MGSLYEEPTALRQHSVSGLPKSHITEDVDVLIIGSGPTGLMLANCFNHSNIKYRMVEKKGAIVPAGQADSLKCLTMQIFESLGISNIVGEGACQFDEVVFWDPNDGGYIQRSGIVPDKVPGLKAIREVSLNQGKIESLLLENIRKHQDLEVEYSKVPSDIYINDKALSDHDEYPFVVMLHPVDNNSAEPLKGVGDPTQITLASLAGPRESLRAKYIVACDGGHSWTRKRFAIPFEGDQTDSLWGVVDIIPKTNFPDIRKNCVIRSAKYGNMMMIPRENRIVRFYVQLLNPNTSLDIPAIKASYTIDSVLKRAQRIFSPYELTYDYCDWWSIYQVGQRIAKHYSIHDRLFLAGDAVHTHSPKAGQGMNTGMQDAYNLGWKLIGTLQKRLHPKVLSTYESERRPVAQELIDFDKGYAQSWAKSAITSDATTPNGTTPNGMTPNGTPPNGTTSNGTTSHGTKSNGMTSNDVTSERVASNGTKSDEISADSNPISFQTMYMQNMVYTTGILIHYSLNELILGTTGPSKGPKAVRFKEGLTPGMRLPDFQMLNQSDAVPTTIHKVMVANGRFRVLVFAGDLTRESQMAKINGLAAGLAAKDSFVNLYRPASARIDSRIEVITIHASPRDQVELQELPEVLHPWNEDLGWDYWKVYADDADIHGEHGEAYRKCAVDKSKGSLVVVRPDGYVGMVTELTNLDSINVYFSGFMIPVLR